MSNGDLKQAKDGLNEYISFGRIWQSFPDFVNASPKSMKSDC